MYKLRFIPTLMLLACLTASAQVKEFDTKSQDTTSLMKSLKEKVGAIRLEKSNLLARKEVLSDAENPEVTRDERLHINGLLAYLTLIDEKDLESSASVSELKLKCKKYASKIQVFADPKDKKAAEQMEESKHALDLIHSLCPSDQK